MKLIILGGGALQVKNIKTSKGMSAQSFIGQVENGTEIFAALRQTTNRLAWASPLGRIDWMERRNRDNPINWFLARPTP